MLDELLGWIPVRVHLTEDLIFPPYATWEDPNQSSIVKFPIYKKVVLFVLLVAIIQRLARGRFDDACLLVVIPIFLHVLWLQPALCWL